MSKNFHFPLPLIIKYILNKQVFNGILVLNINQLSFGHLNYKSTFFILIYYYLNEKLL